MVFHEYQESKSSNRQIKPGDTQGGQLWREETRQATMLLESNAHVMTTLRAYYVELLDHEDFPLRTDCTKYIQDFAADMESNIVCIRMQVRRLDLLAEMINERNIYVCLTKLLAAKDHVADYLRWLNTFRTRLQRGPIS